MTGFYNDLHVSYQKVFDEKIIIVLVNTVMYLPYSRRMQLETE